MKSEKPAEGILKQQDWVEAKSYKIVCDCSDPDHEHDLWIEADEIGVNVLIYVTAKSPWWSVNRFRQIWFLLTKGYIRYETVLTMNEQTALNYAETIKSAIKDVKEFRKKQNA